LVAWSYWYCKAHDTTAAKSVLTAGCLMQYDVIFTTLQPTVSGVH